jgi:enoyl-CoA hydratase/carnithine racemase
VNFKNIICTNLPEGRISIVLNRLDKKNALSSEMIDELCVALKLASVTTKLIDISSADLEVFCSGADKQEANDEKLRGEIFARIAFLGKTLLEVPCPIFVKVSGKVLGGGLIFVGAADVCIATDSFSAQLPELQVGFVPSIVSAFIRRKIPATFLNDMIYTGRVLTSKEALQGGLISRIIEMEDLETKYGEILNSVLSSPASLLQKAKTLIPTDSSSRELDLLADRVKLIAIMNKL